MERLILDIDSAIFFGLACLLAYIILAMIGLYKASVSVKINGRKVWVLKNQELCKDDIIQLSGLPTNRNYNVTWVHQYGEWSNGAFYAGEFIYPCKGMEFSVDLVSNNQA